ncbi:3-hydroxybutyryl-CoA dehydrogenase [Ardenticatena maritima]|uniref:3-hydroxybutyryl-CoA dehydrogenase n=1 Tax=Ardenticatena maritima TaxID=872965 RepID=A0A0M8K836_9CHLR|nr:3-hydroxyacyl-CoA dehydrogenase NAD-binding domain-containing protein [Ardenticatena maritima]KPL87688.1 3-hydroxybutyryl-CoA dehydrogenase [Ardenticatena maritima]GAP62751.1 3-hydroxybutyryl-CoA dehydrogenase [Ardenticatena maritima]
MLESITTIGVIGAGTMGSGIAQVAAQAGYTVRLYDIADDVLQRAVERILHFVNRAAQKGRLDPELARTVPERLHPTTDLHAFADCQVVIEAAPERLDLKQRLFADLESIVAPDAILATNTSTLSVTQIAAATQTPHRVAGMHFFNPAPLMRLVEIVAGAQTAPHVCETLAALAERMGKTPVHAKDVPGFIVNRVARPFYLEGLRLLETGVADHATIDRLIREGGGFKMGPFELMDLIGLDINFAASQSVYNAYFGEPRYRPSLLQQRMVESGRLGRKTGRGWYDYEEDA